MPICKLSIPSEIRTQDPENQEVWEAEILSGATQKRLLTHANRVVDGSFEALMAI